MSVYLRRPKLSDDMNEEEVEQTNNQSQEASTQQPDNSRDYTKEFAIINAKIA
jgi:protein required for attachment to host cells